jgi:hypothetical protein
MECQHFHNECCRCKNCTCRCLKNEDEYVSSRTFECVFKKDCFCIMKCKECYGGIFDCRECNGKGFIGCCLMCRGCIC